MAPNYIGQIGSDVLLRKLPLIHSAPEQCFKLGCGWLSHIASHPSVGVFLVASKVGF